MEGFPLTTAKALMRELVGGLRPIDMFNVILFAGGSRLLAPQSLPATPENVQHALEVIDNEDGGGGTELGEALNRALALPGKDGVSRSTIVITDGYISAEPAVFAGIRAHLNRSNLFAFGIGDSVNRYLVEGMAHAGQGEPFVVEDPAEATAVAARFREYVRSPVLTDVKVATEGFEAYDVEPESIPDLFADRPLIVFGKWRGTASGTIRITGVGGEGSYEKFFDVATAEASADNQVLRYLWARARVARFSDFGAEPGDATRQAVTALGLRYELLTAYTSFIAVHEVVRNQDGGAQTVDQPLPLPQGVSDSAVGDPVPEPELPMLLALLLLLLGLTRWACWTRRTPRRTMA
jgi:Ca-activated chloride channel family protein